MTKYILTVWSSFTPQCVLSYTGQAILVRKNNIHAYSMYVLLADKVSCPMTQHFDSGDLQIINPWIPSLTLYKLSHCASEVHYLCKYDVGGRASFFSLSETQEQHIGHCESACQMLGRAFVLFLASQWGVFFYLGLSCI